jgi:hypothetical protein
MTEMNFQNIRVKEEARHKRLQILYDSMFTKYPEEANPWRQNAESWLPGCR